MKIILMGDHGYIDMGGSYMLCIGSKTEVNKANEKQLVEMIYEAIVWSRYRSIETAKKLAVH